MINELRNSFINGLMQEGLSANVSEWMYIVLLLVGILCITLLYLQVVNFTIIPIIRHITKRTSTKWDDYLLNDRMLNRLKHLVPPIFWYGTLPLFFEASNEPLFLQRCCLIYLIICLLITFATFLDTAYDISTEHQKLKDRPLKGIYQMLKLAAYIIGSIVIISLLINRDATAILTGLGASAAILLLIFKDTILGLVAGVQLNANNMLRAGDWITLPKHNVNGIVTEVTLTTVKVQNFDMTIITIPPYILVSESFQNWRGMKESGGRRIMRNLNIDLNTVRFMSDNEVETLTSKGLLFEDELPTSRPVVNLLAYRIYAQKYILNHPLIDSEMLNMVRQLQPTSEGIPIEIYCFSVQQDWKQYETIQADIFDHLIAILPEFGLHIYQKISGNDIRRNKQGTSFKLFDVEI